jgi:hypothetical protein
VRTWDGWKGVKCVYVLLEAREAAPPPFLCNLQAGGQLRRSKRGKEREREYMRVLVHEYMHECIFIYIYK